MQAGDRGIPYGQTVAVVGHGVVGNGRVRWHVAATGDAVEQRAGDGRLGAFVAVAGAGSEGRARVSKGRGS